jgi:hypothetical protein
MTQRSKEEQAPTKEKFRIGRTDEIIYLLHRRGDTSQTISERYGLRLEDVEAAIDRCRARKRSETGETFHD